MFAAGLVLIARRRPRILSTVPHHLFGVTGVLAVLLDWARCLLEWTDPAELDPGRAPLELGAEPSDRFGCAERARR
jgi:hypothetical protein